MLQHNGLVHLELEGLPNWWADGPLRAQSDEIRRALLTATEQLGARHIKVKLQQLAGAVEGHFVIGQCGTGFVKIVVRLRYFFRA